MLAIERINWAFETRVACAFPLDHVVLRVPPQPVLRPHDRIDLRLPARGEMLENVPVIARDRRLIANQADAFTRDQPEVLFNENIKAGARFHSAGRLLLRRAALKALRRWQVPSLVRRASRLERLKILLIGCGVRLRVHFALGNILMHALHFLVLSLSVLLSFV